MPGPIASASATRSSWRSFASHLLRDPLAMIGLILVVIIVGSAILAPLLVPHDPNKINVRYRLKGPSAEHWIGTDQIGRDVLSRIIMGSRIALQVALFSISIAASCGLLLGMLAGYGPRWLDGAMVVLFDTVRSFPTIIKVSKGMMYEYNGDRSEESILEFASEKPQGAGVRVPALLSLS